MRSRREILCFKRGFQTPPPRYVTAFPVVSLSVTRGNSILVVNPVTTVDPSNEGMRK